MALINRRHFLQLAAALGVLPRIARGQTGPRVVVVGGGFGGATCAKYLRMLDPGIRVTLIERDPWFHTCPFSNLVLGGELEMAQIRHGYTRLGERHGVELVNAEAREIEPLSHRVTLDNGAALRYDRLVLAPGIDIDYDAVEGYDEAASEVMPHAWKAGAQTELLRDQLRAMPDGGTVIIAAPGDPYRCPPGPYERASMIAHYLKHHKPRSKVLILDAKDKFSKQGLFEAGWKELYPGMIEWVSGSDGGKIERVDPATRTLHPTFGFDDQTGDVVNFIPPQHAGAIARNADLTDSSGWCPVNQHTFESTRHASIHVIGDACIAGKMPKSGFSANSQAKICAAAIVSLMRGGPLPAPSYANTCYSLIGPQYGISVAAVYRLEDGKIESVEGAGGVSPADATAEFRFQEARYAHGWYASVTADTFA